MKNRHSLLLSLGVLMASITLLAITSMAASLFIADTIQGQATAINESGALRMRSYRIASSLIHDLPDETHYQTTLTLVNEFKQHLRSPNLTGILPVDINHPLRVSYNNINRQWNDMIEPIFDIYLDGIIDSQANDNLDMIISEGAVINLRNRYFLVVSDFVDDIDNLVSLLEQDSETKIKRLRLYQFIALAMTVILVLAALILVYKRVHIPLKQLLLAAERTSKSDFSFRTSYTNKDELGQLGKAFNSMAEDLSEIYTDLENRVKQKTIDLEQSNRSMELLYKTVRRLNETPSPHITFATIIKDIEQLIDTGKGAICLSAETKDNAAMLASTLQTEDFEHLLCEQQKCQKCFGQGSSQFLSVSKKSGNKINYISVPISDHNQQYGVLIIQAKDKESTNKKFIEPWQQKILESIAGHIGIAIKVSQQAAETRRLSLMEERGAIARELHDSLAQSLTYMKIQVSRLQALLSKPDSKSAAEIVMVELRVGLNSAYKELRELLTTFRLKIDGENFNEAILKTVAEFNERGEVLIECDNQITYCDLTPNEEIHILQLIREALSNIVQHAKASTAKLILQYDPSGNIRVCIEDDGVGLAAEKSQTHHYGLSIMKERAKTINGKFEIKNNPQGGVTILLEFSPANNTVPVNVNRKMSN